MAALLTLVSLLAASATLDHGYDLMYNLDFEDAHRNFSEYKRARPDDAMGPVSDAAAYLFAEFDRLRILQAEFFTHDDNFRNAKKLSPDPAVRKAFDKEMAAAERLAGNALQTQANDRNAMFAMILVHGLRSDYDGLIDKRYLSAFSAMKKGRTYADKLLALDPSYYDAYLAVGVENYMLSLKPAPVRWILQLGGAETDKAKGLAQLRFTAEKGHYLQPFARLLMGVAALRDRNTNLAKEILSGLVRQFPRNHLYAEELARLK
jgi:hypothetical protein